MISVLCRGYQNGGTVGRVGSQSHPHLEDGSVYRQLRPTRLDKIKNLCVDRRSRVVARG